DMAELYVGPQMKLFRVHKELLCKKIPYVRKMFQGGFQEAQQNSATFSEDTEEAFDLLMGWIYTDSV
ncbi:hypothetical protein B0J14DRAFT_488100, partial [Halenospora varia]